MVENAVAIVSGGLDSFVSLAVALKTYDVKLVLLFDYGQKAFESELRAVKSICGHYNLSYKVINLDWLREISTSTLVRQDKSVPDYTLDKLNADLMVLNDSAKSVWVANRNGVMLNIAAAFAEALSCRFVIFGANAEESVTFPDNSIDYVKAQTKAFSYSTANGVEVLSPLHDLVKTDIVKLALSENVPLEMVWSCYNSGDLHCGVCESCNRLKRALLVNNLSHLWGKIAYVTV